MELGQPHACLRSRASSPRASRCERRSPRERITLLDDKEYELDPEFLVIADASGAIGLAGIMGGRAHRDLRFDHAMCCSESAHFTPDAIAGRARRLGSVHRCRTALRARRRSDACRRSPRACHGVAAGDRRRRAGPCAGDARCEDALPTAAEWVSLRRDRLTRLLGARRAGRRGARGAGGDQRSRRGRCRRAGACASRRIASTCASRRI